MISDLRCFSFLFSPTRFEFGPSAFPSASCSAQDALLLSIPQRFGFSGFAFLLLALGAQLSFMALALGS
jgi:hypothetical protein